MEKPLRKEGIPFTQVDNEILNDEKITFKAKGLYAFIYSKPNGWDFSAKRISLQTKEGEDSVQNTLRELESFGYLTRMKSKNGRVEYCLFHSINTVRKGTKPKRGNALMGKRLNGETPPISNKELLVIKTTRKKDSETSSEVLSEITYEPVEETYKTKEKIFKQKGLPYQKKKITNKQKDFFNVDKLGKYYLAEHQKIHGFTPAFSYAKSGKNYSIAKKRLKQYSVDECKTFIKKHLSSETPLGYDFSICLCDNVVNKNLKKTKTKLYEPHY